MTPDRLMHSFTVAKVMYLLTRDVLGGSEVDAETAFVVGLNHDIGYCNPAAVSLTHQKLGQKAVSSMSHRLGILVGAHGKPDTCYGHFKDGELLFLLDLADNSTTGAGEIVSYAARVEDIRHRCPPEALKYTQAVFDNMSSYANSTLRGSNPRLFHVWQMYSDGTLLQYLQQNWHKVEF